MQGDNILTLLIVYGGVVLVTFWIAMIIWTYRDMRARSRDPLAQILVAVMVAILNAPGLLVYTLLRPRETLSEAYERSLEEEALLQEIEDKPTCPGCSQRVQDEWQVCPYCHTRLKKACIRCAKPLELAWSLCPHCATHQGNYDINVASDYDSTSRRSQAVIRDAPRVTSRTQNDPAQAGSLQFVDGDDY